VRSKLQKWSRERCWHLKGSLAGIIVRISQIAAAESTTPDEYQALIRANDILQGVSDKWNLHKDESKELYMTRGK
jgi:hypothetical protein